MKDTISYDDFVKLDIVLGTIRSVEIVEGADRLLKLTVDMGEDEPRQIVSGIREYVADPNDLVGMQCPFVRNLKPREIRGLQSEGMILAAHDDSVFSLLTPETSLSNGTRIA